MTSTSTPYWRWERITRAKSRTSRRWQVRTSLSLPTPVRHIWKASARLRVSHTRRAKFLQDDERPNVAVLNADDDYYEYWTSLVEDVQVISFRSLRSADVRASDIVTSADGSAFRLHLAARSVHRLPLAGVHNVRNACAAAAIACACGMDGQKSRPRWKRCARRRSPAARLGRNQRCTLFDDSYNANPLSVVAAAEFLASLDGESWLCSAT